MTSKNKNRMLVAALFWLCILPVQAQNSNDLLTQYQKKYPDKLGVYLYKHAEVSITEQKGQLDIKSKHSYDFLHLDDQSNAFAKESLYNNHFVSLDKVEAYSLVPHNGKYKKAKVEHFSLKDDLRSSVFYDDTKITSFVFPAVKPGVRNILTYEESFKEPRFLQSFFFVSNVPMEKAQLKIVTGKNVNIKYKLFNTEKLKINFTKQDQGGQIIYTWQAEQIADSKFEEDAPSASYILPHIVYWIEEYNNGSKQPILRGPDDLYSFYKGFIKGLDQENDPKLKATVDSLVANATTEEEKVKNIYYWVQDHVKYIAFEDGMRGFVPNKASKVYYNRYGDCKDMSSITWTMLRMAGIENTYLAWIGTRKLPYSYYDVPTPAVDNHMIAVYKNKENFYFLDATSRHTPFGTPSSMIQGKEALIALGEGFKISKVPVLEKDKNKSVDSIYLKIQDKVVTGKGMFSLNGYPKIMSTYRLEGMEKTDEAKSIQRLLSKGHNKFFVDQYKIKDFTERELPLSIQYDCRIEDYHRNLGDEIFINLNLDKAYANDKIELDKRQHPMENEYKFSDKQIVVLEIPKGYKVDYLPENMSFSDELFSFNISYKEEKNRIILERNLVMNHLLLPSVKFADWNSMIEKLNEAYREVVILKKHN